MDTLEITKIDIEITQDVDYSKIYNLILWNDDVNDFAWVITALVEVCELDVEKAYEIMIDAHENGKSLAKSGEFSDMEKMQKALNDREINATIEVNS